MQAEALKPHIAWRHFALCEQVLACREKKRSRAQQKLRQLWASTKAFLYPRVKHYKSRQQKAAEAESKGLKGGQVIDAETPKGGNHEMVIHMTGEGHMLLLPCTQKHAAMIRPGSARLPWHVDVPSFCCPIHHFLPFRSR